MAEFTRTRGDTWKFNLPLLEFGTVDPFDLTGTTIRVTFKTNKKLADDAAGVFQYSWISGGASDGIAVPDPTAGLAVVTVPAADTADFLITTYFYDCQVTDANGEPYTPDKGKVKVTEDVTQTVP